MTEGKSRHTVWLAHDAWAKVENHYRADNCSTKNEFIEKAIRFYAGYLDADEDSSFLPAALSRELDGKLSTLAKRVGRMLFKLAVDQNMMYHLISALTTADLDVLQKLRTKCIREVKETNGEIDLEDVYKYQKQIE